MKAVKYIIVICFFSLGKSYHEPLSNEEYKISSCVIQNIIDSTTGIRDIVITDSTDNLFTCFIPIHASFKSKCGDQLKPLLDKYCALNKVKYKIDVENLDLGKSSLKIYSKSIKEIKEYDFEKNKSLFVTFSKPALNDSQNTAIIYMYYWVNKLNGSGVMYYLEKSDSYWHIVATNYIETK